jgi:hypothetical protein
VILEARRHLLDFADMTPAELAEVGSILKHEGELLGAAYLAQQPPLTSSFGDAEAMSDKIREQFKQS